MDSSSNFSHHPGTAAQMLKMPLQASLTIIMRSWTRSIVPTGAT